MMMLVYALFIHNGYDEVRAVAMAFIYVHATTHEVTHDCQCVVCDCSVVLVSGLASCKIIMWGCCFS